MAARIALWVARRILIESISIESTIPTAHEIAVAADQFVVNFFAPFREKLLRVVQPAMPKFFREDDCGRYDRPGERAPARFIDAGDRRDTKRAQSAFMPETTATDT